MTSTKANRLPWAGPTPIDRFLHNPCGELRRMLHAAAYAISHATATVLILIAVIATVLLVRTTLTLWRHGRLTRGARIVEILPPPNADMAGAEALWTQVMGLLRPRWLRLVTGVPHLAWEYVFTSAGVRIQLWVPGVIPPSLVERTIEGAWPGATTRAIPAGRATTHASCPSGRRAVPAANQPVHSAGHLFAGGRLRLARPDHYPLRSDLDVDPLRGLLSSAGSLHGAETVTVQVLARPVTGRRLRRAARYATSLRSPGTTSGLKAGLFDLLPIGPHSRTSPARPLAQASGDVRAILSKASHPRLETLIRYAVTTGNPAGGAWLRGRAHAIAAAYAAYTGANHLRRQQQNRCAELIRSRRMTRGDLLSVPELAALCHLPIDEIVPGLTRAGARPTPPPPSVPSAGPDVRVLGDADSGPRRAVGIRVADARHHTHVIGETGAGKTTFLLSMQLADAHAGRGLVSIESKGDSTTILSRLPEHLIGKVAVIDPDDAATPPCVNILDGATPEVTADVVVGIFRRIYADFWGPRTDDVLRAALLTATIRPGATLADIPRLLSDDAVRAQAIAQVTNPVLLDFWNWYADLSPAQQTQVTGPVMNKLRAVLLRGFARSVLAAGPTSLDIGRILDDGGLLIARLPKGILGEDAARLLGSLILAKTWQAVQARAPRRDTDRPDCAIYVDECHNFLTLPHGLDDMLAEARSYRAGLVLAHQNLTQLPTALRESLSANARNKIIFASSPNDARHLETHTTPNLRAHDLANLGAFQAAARLLDHGAPTPAFTFRTRPLPPPVPGRATAIRKASRTRYGPKPATDAAPGPLPGDPRNAVRPHEPGD